MEEVWKPVVGYEGYYEVSNLGRVKSLPRLDVRKVPRGGFVMIPTINCRTGYFDIKLCKDGMAKRVKVHCLVLEAFVGPRPEGYHACHGPNGSGDNSVVNLRWDTPKANGEDKVLHGTVARGEKNGGGGKLTFEQVVAIKEILKTKINRARLARDNKVTRGTIYDIEKGRIWAHVPC